jgi:hypothetical protein
MQQGKIAVLGFKHWFKYAEVWFHCG